MRLRARRAAIRSLVVLVGVLTAGCDTESGLELLERTALNTGDAWCRQAETCYPACDPEEATHCGR